MSLHIVILECNDEEADCSKWAEVGECQKNPTYMLKSCKKSCKACGTYILSSNTTRDRQITTSHL